jgi:hypothetical protein
MSATVWLPRSHTKRSRTSGAKRGQSGQHRLGRPLPRDHRALHARHEALAGVVTGQRDARNAGFLISRSAR